MQQSTGQRDYAVASGSSNGNPVGFQLPYGHFPPLAGEDAEGHQQLMALLSSIDQQPSSLTPLPPASNAFSHFAQATAQQSFLPDDDMHAPTASGSSGILGDYRGTSTGSTSFSVDGTWDDSEFAFTPLVSPAMTPLSTLLSPQVHALKNGGGQGTHVSPAEVFSPLTSPALQPQDAHMTTDMVNSPHMRRLAEQASALGLDGFQLPRAINDGMGMPMNNGMSASRGRGASRTAPKSRPSPIIKPLGRSARNSAPPTPSSAGPPPESSRSTPSPIDIDVGAAIDPSLRIDVLPELDLEMMPPPPLPVHAAVPATPSSLMKLGIEVPPPGAYEQQDTESSAGTSPILAGQKRGGKRQGGKPPKSNRNSVEFALNTLATNGPPPEERRHSHRAAEQRRRDSLKLCFEELRPLLPHIPPEEDEEAIAAKRPGEGNVAGQRVSGVDPHHPNKGVSKVALLRKSNAYIVSLTRRIKARDDTLQRLKEKYDIPEDELLPDDWEEEWPWNGTPGNEANSPYSQAAIQAAAIANGTYVDQDGSSKAGVVTRNRSKRNSMLEL